MAQCFIDRNRGEVCAMTRLPKQRNRCCRRALSVGAADFKDKLTRVAVACRCGKRSQQFEAAPCRFFVMEGHRDESLRRK